MLALKVKKIGKTTANDAPTRKDLSFWLSKLDSLNSSSIVANKNRIKIAPK